MARRNYYNRGDWYSEWSRNVENRRIGFCDIDAVGTFGPNASFVSLDVLEHRICHP